MFRFVFDLNCSLNEALLKVVGEPCIEKEYYTCSLGELADRYTDFKPMLCVEDEEFFSYGVYSFCKESGYNFTKGSMVVPVLSLSMCEIRLYEESIKSLFKGLLVGSIRLVCEREGCN